VIGMKAPKVPKDEQAISTEEMLAEEAELLGSEKISVPECLKKSDGQPDGADNHSKHTSEQAHARLDADERSGADVDPAIVAARKDLYRSLNGLNRAALCFSGGGIRSATFCLGILQALAAYDATQFEPSGGEPQSDSATPITPANSLLGRFHYLSTVSGGGYVGSWLSSWRQRDSFAEILKNLTGRPSGTDFEPAEISWLRSYSNYLTPRLGIGSADSWAALAIVVRNLVLNWLVIIPVVCIALLGLKFVAAISVWAAHAVDNSWITISLALGAICLIFAQAFTTRHRPARIGRPTTAATAPPPCHDPKGTTAEQTSVSPAQTAAAPQPDPKCLLCRRPIKREKPYPCGLVNVDDRCFLCGDLLWAALSAIFVTVFFTSRYFAELPGSLSKYFSGGVILSTVQRLGLTPKLEIPLLCAIASFFLYLVGWLAAWQFGRHWRRDWLSWSLSGLIYGALVGYGAYLFTLLSPYPACPAPNPAGGCLLTLTTPVPVRPLLIGLIFGVPWVIMAQLTADNIFGGLRSYEPYSDSDREWLGRAAGWLAAFATGWAIAAFLVFAAGYALESANIAAAFKDKIAASGIISGVVTALLGRSSKTPAKSSSADATDWWAIASNIALAIAGPIFAAVLIVALSIGLDKLLLDHSLVKLLREPNPDMWMLAWLGGGGVLAFAIAFVASLYVNINRFSLHALYRNRLVRAYLGASLQKRNPDRFTGFDPTDNVRMHKLWPPMSQEPRLFHVVNIALNVVAAERLAWQERKAESFTVTPKHCGSAYLGFRNSAFYGDGPKNEIAKKDQNRQFGIALGTAMAISGAAVSSNMGYHSSPSLGILLTLFNVRLGWWLGNPGPDGDKQHAYRREGPRFSALPLLFEAFGQTTDKRPYVYLSDGGHFENLGLYEMVRRRCRLIVLVDAGCDADFAFEDLGNAVRKIYIDLGIRITFEKLEDLKNRPSEKTLRRAGEPGIRYHAIGTIRYSDPSADGSGCKDGKVIYIKPAYHGGEGAAIQAYAKANKAFPHESTTDQWFTESQFESYRALGLDIANDVLDQQDVRVTLERFFSA
jgi:hypothetical protein